MVCDSAFLDRASDIFVLSCVSARSSRWIVFHSIRRWSSVVFLQSDHSCLTSIHKDGLESSQDPPTTVDQRQLVSREWCELWTMRDTIYSSK